MLSAGQVKRMQISGDVVREWLQAERDYFLWLGRDVKCVSDRLPDDAVIVGASVTPFGGLELVWRSAEFGVVLEGSVIPTIEPCIMAVAREGGA